MHIKNCINNSQGNNLYIKHYLDHLNRDINEIVVASKKEISECKRKKYYSVLILDVYHRDIVESFIINK